MILDALGLVSAVLGLWALTRLLRRRREILEQTVDDWLDEQW